MLFERSLLWLSICYVLCSVCVFNDLVVWGAGFIVLHRPLLSDDELDFAATIDKVAPHPRNMTYDRIVNALQPLTTSEERSSPNPGPARNAAQIDFGLT
eukprot:4136654-Amphidinium_carterae.1